MRHAGRSSVASRARLTVGALLVTTLALACQKPDPNTAPSVARNDVLFDHAKCTKGAEATDACLPEYRIHRRDGDLFTVRIVHTDSLEFNYTIAGVLIAHEDNGGVQKRKGPPNDVVDLTQQHDKKFGG